MDFSDFRSHFRDFELDFKDFRDFTSDLRHRRSDFKDYRNFREYRDFRHDFRDFRSSFRTFVHRISDAVCPSNSAMKQYLTLQNAKMLRAEENLLFSRQKREGDFLWSKNETPFAFCLKMEHRLSSRSVVPIEAHAPGSR